MTLPIQLNRLAAALLASALAAGAAAAQDGGKDPSAGAAPKAEAGATPAAPTGHDASAAGEGAQPDDMAGAAGEEAEDAPEPADEESVEEAQPGDDTGDRRAARAEMTADVEAQYADLRTRFETALAAGDVDGIGALFTRRSLVTPVTGDTLEGMREIEGFYRDSPKPEAVQFRSQQMDRFGRTILDAGTLSLRMPASAGGGTAESEYVMLARMTRNGMKIMRLMLFPARQAAAAPAQ
jgi:hypothetical protein